MSNQQPNATFLDGVTGAAGANLTLTVDESIYGAEGRIALVGSVSSPGVATLALPAVTVVANQLTEVFLHAGVVNGSSTTVSLRTGSPGSYTYVQVPLVKAAEGLPRRGLPGSFGYYYGKVRPVDGGAAQLVITSNLSSGGKIAVVKPFVDPSAPTKGKQCWQPGPHSNPDLNLPSWPTDLPDLDADGFEPTSNQSRKGFTADDFVESTVRVSRQRRVMLRGTLTLNMEERDRLEQFFTNTAEPFWFTRRDTQQVYQARWAADGEPTDSGLIIGQRKTAVGLNLSLS